MRRLSLKNDEKDSVGAARFDSTRHPKSQVFFTEANKKRQLGSAAGLLC